MTNDTRPIEVDLYSDTLTKPTPEMRRFMCEAEVGDEQKGEDPTVNLLQDMVAELLGKEAAVFLPSGTMCNEIALRVHCRPGDEMLAHRTAHPDPLRGRRPGRPRRRQRAPARRPARPVRRAPRVEAGIRPDARYAPRSRLLWVEQTSESRRRLDLVARAVEAVAAVARARRPATHMDGARLMNAVVAAGMSARDYAAPFDSAWIDFTKGLGAPVGAALAGSREFIAEAWRCKQQMGGAMRQAGIIAAGGVYALRHHVEAPRRGSRQRAASRRGPGRRCPASSSIPPTVETNIVFFELTGALDASAAVERLLAHGVRMGALGPRTIRAVTHLDVSAAGIERALAAAREVFR